MTGFYMNCDPEVNIAYVCHHGESWRWETDPFTDFDLWLICDGYGELKHNGEAFTMSRGDCFIFQPGSSCIAKCDKPPSLTLIAVHFDLREKDHVKMTESDIPFYRKVADTSFLIHVLERVVFALQDGNKQLAAIWLKSALEEIDGKQPPAWILPGPRGGHFWKIDEICEKIMLNPEIDWDVQNIADNIGLSCQHFSKIFHTYKGCSPIEFIVKTRIDAVKHLLVSSHYTLGEIMEITGYKSFSFFSRQFKKQMGISPSSFRSKFKYLGLSNHEF